MELTLLRRKLDALLRTATGAEAVDPAASEATPAASSNTAAAAAKQPLTTLEALTQEEGGTEVDAHGRVLNEEGLPFVDVVEPAAEEEASASSAAAAVAKEQAPQRSMSAEERNKWMADVFAKLASEEEAELASDDEQVPLPNAAPSTPSRSSPAAAAAPSPSPPTTPIIASSSRPAPRRSALKRTHSNASSTSTPTTAIPPPMALARTPPNFGAAGVRRGFLNLNPSSPAAERSSDPIAAAGAALASASPAGAARAMAKLKLTAHGRESSTERSTDEEDDVRMSRSEELPGSNGRGAGGKKKSVRIMSPTRTRSRSPPRRRFARGGRPLPSWQPASSATAAAGSSTAAAKQPREADDAGVEEEARRIVQLLGPAVVRGHPNAPKDLEAMQRAKEEDDRNRLAALQPHAQGEEEEEEFDVPRREPRKPVMQQTVFERTPLNAAPAPPAAAASQSSKPTHSTSASASAKPGSAFKRGFLNRASAGPPKSSLARSAAAAAAAASSSASAPSASPHLPSSTTSTAPPAPRVSQGVSALERSLRADERAEAAAEGEGAEKPPLPHARPSKAFAAKLEARKRAAAGESVPSSSQPELGDEEKEREGRVRFAESVVLGETTPKGKGKGVAFAEPSSSAPQDEAEHDAPNLTGDAMGFTDAHPRVDHAGDLSDEEHRPYASGSSDDDGEEDADSLQWASDDSLDLDELAPSFSALASDFESAELAREYELAKAQLESARERAALSMLAGNATEEWEGEEDDDDDGYVPIDHGVEEEGPGVRKESRFRASRVARAAGYQVPRSKQLSTPSASASNGKARATTLAEEDDVDDTTRRADEAGHELAHLLESAQNVGPHSSGADTQDPSSTSISTDGGTGIGAGAHGIRPVMVIPSLAPVRYPRNARQLLSGSGEGGDDAPAPAPGPVALEADEAHDYEEEREEALMDVMRARLGAREMGLANAQLGGEMKREEPDQTRPPVVAARVRESKEEKEAAKQEQTPASASAQPPKKVSRFKAARQMAQ